MPAAELADENDHHRGDQRFGHRPPERFGEVCEGEVDAGAPGGAVDTPPVRQRFGEERDPADDREGDQPNRHQRCPVAAVEPPSRSSRSGSEVLSQPTPDPFWPLPR